MNLDLRDIPVVYINMDKDVEKRKRIENHIDTIGFKNKIRVVVRRGSQLHAFPHTG
mgnify:CR=1 FL=1